MSEKSVVLPFSQSWMYRTSIMLHFFLLVYFLSSSTCSEVLNRHKRTWIIDSFEIEEGEPKPFPYELGEIKIEQDYRVFFELSGQGVDKEPKGVLSIDRDTGMMYVHKALDYEKTKTLSLEFSSKKKSDSSLDTNLGIEIQVKDINDNPPRFLKNLYEVNAQERQAQGTALAMVQAMDVDMAGSPNSTFSFYIKSVSPDVPDTAFYIEQSGVISFKGCLDYEKAEKFTVLVEAKDHGNVVSLSSSTTVVINVEDGNNHIPKISGQTGPGRVKERDSGTSPLRLHVTDKDSVNTPAWRARFTIQGDEGGHFRIETDPDTNDGVLTVVKPLDFEEGAKRELSISVENEVPYYTCTVKDKGGKPTDLWTVETTSASDQALAQTVKVTIEVEDVNDPPVFQVLVKDASLQENAPKGTWVEKVTAVDNDSIHARSFVYKIGSDPADWMTVDPKTGDITTVNIPDRESPHVVDGVYTILLLAVDEGDPPMTGTATVHIRLADHNDNRPQLTTNVIDVCVSESQTTTNITAYDLDEHPFGGPFIFELLGDVKGKWSLNPSYGFTAGLVKEPGVYAGIHMVDVKITAVQGEFAIHNISVTACECSGVPHCRRGLGAITTAAPAVIGLIFAALLLLLLLLLLSLFISCKKELISFPIDDSSGETLIASNIETPGTDCKMPNLVKVVATENTNEDQTDRQTLQDVQQVRQLQTMGMQQSYMSAHTENFMSESQSYQATQNWNQSSWNSQAANYYNEEENWNSQLANGYYNEQGNWNSQLANGYHHSQKKGARRSTMSSHTGHMGGAAILSLLHQRLTYVQGGEEDMEEDYEPRVYTEEGDGDTQSELDCITIPDNDSFQDTLEDLGPHFKPLASICKKPDA